MANILTSKWYIFFFDPKVRMTLSVAIGLLVYLLLPRETEFEIRILLAWDLGIIFLLTVIFIMMKKADPQATMHRAQIQEPSNMATLTFTVLTSAASLVAVAFMLNDGKHWDDDPANFHLGLCTVAIFLAWFILHTFFALHYARLYYDELDEPSDKAFKGGLEFPGGQLPDYWDFMYYSFTIAFCYQTSDVSISSTSMRRLTLVHSILSFIFVALVVGLVVNVVSNLA